MFSLIVGIAAAVMTCIIFLIRWNSLLDKEVQLRTKRLEDSNKQITVTNVELEKANIKLQNQKKMQKEFINIAAHELRTPIQPILGLTEFVKNKTMDGEQKELLDIVIRNTKKLKNLAENILDLTKIESNSLHLNKERFDIVKLLVEIVNELQNNLYNNKEIVLEFDGENTDSIIIYATKFGFPKLFPI
jgi:signal transduction histidine kinase